MQHAKSMLVQKKWVKYMEILRDLYPCIISPEAYQEQKNIVEVFSKNWRASIERKIARKTKAPDVTGFIPDQYYLASNSKWKEEPFGAANDMEHSGCIIFVAKHLLDFYGVQTTVLDLKNLAVEKGYRAWKFEKTKKAFYTPKATLKEALQVLPESADKDTDQTLEDTEKYIGKPVGIGGMHILLDNIIAEYACCLPVQDTRLLLIEEVYQELKKGNMVPMRVENSIYLNDPEKEGGHFVILVEIKDQIATVIDPSIGEDQIPVHVLFQAATVAWKVRPRQKPINHPRAHY